MNIAFFDFDGTITTDDSLIRFVRFAVGDVKFTLGMAALSPMLVTYKLKLIPNYKAKQMLLSYFFKGMREEVFQALAREFSLGHIDPVLRPKAMEKIAWHKERGHKVVIVTASIECWLKPWCDKNDIDLIATRLEVVNGRITGKLATRNCYGIEKVNRIRESYDLTEYGTIYAYGDSAGDKEMLGIANKFYYRYFESP